MSGKKIRQMVQEFEREKALNKLAKPGQHELILVLDHLKPDFNIGKIIRSADAFGVREIHLVGVPFFHPGPAMGSFRHVPGKFFENFSDCYAYLKENDYTIYVFEPVDGVLLKDNVLSKKSAFVMGHEEFGVSFKKSDFEGIKTVTIPQFGKVQSLNVSIAASIAMYEYVRQNA